MIGQKIHIVYRSDLAYATRLKDNTIIAADKQEIPYEVYVYDSDLSSVTVGPTELCFVITNGANMKNFINKNTIDNDALIVGSDLTYDFDGEFPDKKVYVILQAPNNVTSTTINLYSYLYLMMGYQKKNQLIFMN